MEGLTSIFPFNVLDTKWFYSSIVPKNDSGARENGMANGSSSHDESNEDGEVTRLLADVDLSATNDHAKGPENGATSVGTPGNRIPDEKEMRRVFERFDANKDGTISAEEMKAFMAKLGFEMSDEELTVMVKSVDKNGDGAVDFHEFYSLYQEMTGATTTGSEDLDEDEIDESLLEAFRVFDKNNDGYITVQELQSVLVSLGMPEGGSIKKCNQMIESVDKDGNGQVDFNEFKKMMNCNSF